LGRDPFEDMEGLDWDEADSTVDKAGVDEAVVDEIAADKATVDKTATETKVVESESVPSTGSGHSPNPADGPALAQAETQPETVLIGTDARAEVEAVDPLAEAEAAETEPVSDQAEAPLETGPVRTDAGAEAAAVEPLAEAEAVETESVSSQAEAPPETETVETDAGAEAAAVEPLAEAETVEIQLVSGQAEAPPETEPIETDARAETASVEPLAEAEVVEIELVSDQAETPPETDLVETDARAETASVEPLAEAEVVEIKLVSDQAEAPPATEPVEAAARIEPATEAEESVAAAPAGEPRPVPPVDGGEVVAQPDEGASNFLDELIATIDKEVEQAFGREAMADLAATAPVRAGGEEQHVIFALAGTEYAVPIANVTEIGQPLDVTPVPNAPDWVLGVTNLRGDIVSVVDMRTFLGMERIGYGQASRMLVAQARQEDMATSLIVDRVSGIRYLSVDRISAPTAVIEDQVAPYLRGVYEHDGPLLVVLDFDKLLLSPEMQQFQPM
jgi:purine-binding chemotaxis protein CheW